MATLALLPSALLLHSLGGNLALLGLTLALLVKWLPNTPTRGSSLAVRCVVLDLVAPLVWMQACWLQLLLLLPPFSLQPLGLLQLPLAQLSSKLLLRSQRGNLALLGLEHFEFSLPKTPARGLSLAV